MSHQQWDNQSYINSLSVGSLLGSAVGSLYPAIFAMSLLESFGIRSFLMLFVAAVFFSCPVLMGVSRLIGPYVVAWLVRYSRQRTLVFAMAGGIIGVVFFCLCFLAFLATRPSTNWLNPMMAGIHFSICTIMFCYAALTGAITSIDLGSKLDRALQKDPQ